MIHTMTIQREIYQTAAYRLLNAMECPQYEINAFLRGEESPTAHKVRSTITKRLPATGIHELSVSRSVRSTRQGGLYVAYYAFVRMDPLTMVTKEKHIALFECSNGNIERLTQDFRYFMAEYLQLDGQPSSLNEIAELETWDMNRIDFTIDVRMRNHDEVLTMMNLCKMSVYSNQQRGALESTSLYGKHFSEDMFKFGNQTWEVEIYDKQSEIRNHRNEYIKTYDSKDIYDRLERESQNILRFEYRRKPNGTRKHSTSFETRGVMQFMSEKMAQEWFHAWYGKFIGYEPFYVLDYQLKKKLGEGFPLSKQEAHREKVRKQRYDKAKVDGQPLAPYKKQLMGYKAQKYWDHMAFIVAHKGMQNALDAYDGSTSTFKAMNKRIRERAHVSPVAIPKNWCYRRPNGNGRALDIPHDFLPNPIRRPNGVGDAR